MKRAYIVRDQDEGFQEMEPMSDEDDEVFDDMNFVYEEFDKSDDEPHETKPPVEIINEEGLKEAQEETIKPELLTPSEKIEELNKHNEMLKKIDFKPPEWAKKYHFSQ